MPRSAVIGSTGALKARGMSGRLTRMIQTPMQTRMNAKSVPMLVISPTMSSGRNAAKIAVKKKNSQFDLYGVLKRGCTSEKTFGNRPSWHMEYNTRYWPLSITSITDEKHVWNELAPTFECK